jgi:hypothetical protein
MDPQGKKPAQEEHRKCVPSEIPDEASREVGSARFPFSKHLANEANRAFLSRGTKPFFIHLIAPRITIANGQVLLLPSDASHPRFSGIDPRNVLAGSAIRYVGERSFESARTEPEREHEPSTENREA